jgi:hypothetical protein
MKDREVKFVNCIETMTFYRTYGMRKDMGFCIDLDALEIKKLEGYTEPKIVTLLNGDKIGQKLLTLEDEMQIDEMLKKIEAEGAKKEFIVAKLTGAANMFSASIGKIGEDNLSYAREKLKHVGVSIAGECIGGTQGRSVEFSIATGIVTVKTKF